ncbi:MAG: hypothetical protein H0X33_06925 [Taibaiella sp.]|nr:hypothetical protein [Taibaiella sp.]
MLRRQIRNGVFLISENVMYRKAVSESMHVFKDTTENTDRNIYVGGGIGIVRTANKKIYDVMYLDVNNIDSVLHLLCK